MSTRAYVVFFATAISAPVHAQEWFVDAQASGCHQVAVRGDLGFPQIEGMALDPGTGTLYGSNVGTGQLVTIDAVTGAATAIGPIGFTAVSALAFDPNTNTLYGHDALVDQLLRIDVTTGAGTTVGAPTMDVRSLAFDPNTNTLYGTTHLLVTIDTSTGAISDIGSTGAGVNGLAFDPDSNTLYGTGFVLGGGGDGFLTLDPTTGMATLLEEFTISNLAGLAFDPATGSLFASERYPDVLVSFLPGSGLHGDGSAGMPFCKVQRGIDAASNQDVVRVRPGVYFESIDFLGKAITLRSDSDGDPQTYDPAPETTVLDGHEAGPVVRFESGEGRDSVLEGFTVRNGASLSDPGGGGGVVVRDSSPTIRGNLIRDNRNAVGGGVSCWNGSPRIARNIIRDNIGPLSGTAAISCRTSPADITGNVIVGNCGGSVVLCDSSSPVNFVGNLVSDNDATIEGICVVPGGSTVVGNEFSGNRAFAGGGIRVGGDGTLIANNLIDENVASMAGGGIQCLFNSNPLIVNNTIAFNEAFSAGGIHLQRGSTATIWNNVVWANTPPGFPQIDGGAPVVEYCIVDGGWPGAGNSSSDPMFVDPANGKYRVLPTSPCIDAGNSSAVPGSILRDIRGAPRILDDPTVIDTGIGGPPTVDIGPFESFTRGPLNAAGVPLTVAPGRTLR